MGAELLREAASEMRRDAGLMDHGDHVFLHAVADWLDMIAAARDAEHHVAFQDQALTVAHAYLGDL